MKKIPDIRRIIAVNKSLVGKIRLRKKDLIENKKYGLNVHLEEQKGTSNMSMLFCNRIEYWHKRGKFDKHPYFDHHLMFLINDKLIFKVWLKNKPKDKEFNDIDDALDSVGMHCEEREYYLPKKYK
ncbi:MAG: hypothetical protein AABW88_04840 [Nanoarchaeota archaeon]